MIRASRVAVHPGFQGRGIGSQLIRATLGTPSIEREPVFVLGDPAYYERFGFAPTATARCPFDKDNEFFRALRWRESSEPFTIQYSGAFDIFGDDAAANP